MTSKPQRPTLIIIGTLRPRSVLSVKTVPADKEQAVTKLQLSHGASKTTHKQHSVTCNLPREVGHMGFHSHPTLRCPLAFYQDALTKPVKNPKFIYKPFS